MRFLDTFSRLNVVTVVFARLLILFVFLMEIVLMLEVAAGKREYNDAGNLDAEVAPDAESVIGEQGD